VTKKKSSEILADGNQEIFSGEGKIEKIFHGMSKFFRKQNVCPGARLGSLRPCTQSAIVARILVSLI